MSEPFYESVERGSSVDHRRTRTAIDLARGLDARRILDVGSGHGENSAALATATGATVVCIDVSDVAVQGCRDRGLEAHRVAIGNSTLPFGDGAFDLVYMTEVIEHLLHPDRALEEVHRVLRRGGHLVLSTPNLACLPNRLLLLLGIQPIFTEVSEDRILGRRFHFLGQGGRTVGHLRIYTKRALLELLGSCGFKPLRLRGVEMHQSGILSLFERLASLSPACAMILIVLAQKKDQGIAGDVGRDARRV